MIQSRLRRNVLALAAAATTPLLTGCQPQKLIVRINNQAITEEDFSARVQKVRTRDFPQDLNTDAGGVTLLNIIQSTLVDQCAAEPSLKATPSDETLKSYLNQVLRMNPDIVNRIKAGEMTQEDVTAQVKTRLEMLSIGTDGAKPDDSDISKMYEELQKKHAADYPALYTIRFITVPDPTLARSVLDSLKKTGDFKAQAQLLNVPPEAAGQLGKATVFAQNQLPPKIVSALDALKPNEFTPEPIDIPAPQQTNPQAPPGQTRYMVAQLVAKEPAKTPTIQEIHAPLAQMALEKKFPEWNQHAAQRIAEYTQKANIEVMVDRYKSLVASVVIPSAKRSAAAAAGMGNGAAGVAPGGASNPGAGAPPSGGVQPGGPQ